MRLCGKALVLSLILLAIPGSARLNAQDESRPEVTRFLAEDADPTGLSDGQRRLAPAEILVRLGQQIGSTDLDCSHFVQSLFERVGLYYDYAPSRILYAGTSGFQRVMHPRPGDLVVWPGHVGVVVDPDEETFFSALRTGVKTSSYTSRYWKRRGIPHFFRYLPGADTTGAQGLQVLAGRHADSSSTE